MKSVTKINLNNIYHNAKCRERIESLSLGGGRDDNLIQRFNTDQNINYFIMNDSKKKCVDIKTESI